MLSNGRWIDDSETEGKFFRAKLEQFGVDRQPKNGWSNLAYELRLVEISLPDRTKPDDIGRAELARQAQKLSVDAKKLQSDFVRANENIDFMVAMHFSAGVSKGGQAQRIVSELALFCRELDACAQRLKEMPQSPKWRQKELRNIRLELACKLAVLFETEFGLPAKPVGGSASLSLSETNCWTRFYQAIASAFWQEEATPDRQAILWEATWPPA